MLYYFIVKAKCYHSRKLLKLEVTSATDSAESFWVIVYHLHMHIHLHTQAHIRFTSSEYSSVLFIIVKPSNGFWSIFFRIYQVYAWYVTYQVTVKVL